jgi:hypothetical protein
MTPLMPAGEDGGWGVVAVWAGSGLEGTWEDGAEDDVGVDAAWWKSLALLFK